MLSTWVERYQYREIQARKKRSLMILHQEKKKKASCPCFRIHLRRRKTVRCIDVCNVFLEDPVVSVGTPFNVQHNIHVDFNSVTGFEGLPHEWEIALKTNDIQKTDVLNNPDAVLDVLKFNDQYQKQMAMPNKGVPRPQAPVQQEAYSPAELPEEKAVTLSDLISREDPGTLFRDAKKIGEGAAGMMMMMTTITFGFVIKGIHSFDDKTKGDCSHHHHIVDWIKVRCSWHTIHGRMSKWRLRK